MANHRWFRMYEDVCDNPKIVLLPNHLVKPWLVCMALASRGEGPLPCMRAVAVAMRQTRAKTKVIIEALVTSGLLDRNPDTGVVIPHNWFQRQYKTDRLDPTHQARVSRQRVAQESVFESVVESPSSRPESETESESESESDSESLSKREKEAAKVESKAEVNDDPWKDLVTEMGLHYFEVNCGNVPNSYGFILNCKDAGFNVEVVRSELHHLWTTKPKAPPKYLWDKLIDIHNGLAKAKAKPQAIVRLGSPIWQEPDQECIKAQMWFVAQYKKTQRWDWNLGHPPDMLGTKMSPVVLRFHGYEEGNNMLANLARETGNGAA